jgi:hypothetical protein
MFPCEQTVSNRTNLAAVLGKRKGGLTCAFVWSG